MANDLPYDSYGSNGPQVYQPDTFQPSPQPGLSQVTANKTHPSSPTSFPNPQPTTQSSPPSNSPNLSSNPSQPAPVIQTTPQSTQQTPNLSDSEVNSDSTSQPPVNTKPAQTLDPTPFYPEDNRRDALPPTPTGSLAKEQLESTPANYNETVPLTEITSEHDKIPEAVEGWLEKLERQEDIKLDQPITDDQNQPVLQSATPQVTDDQIVLPLEEADVSQGIKQKPTSSIRWLAEWCLRVIKKFPGKVFYAS